MTIILEPDSLTTAYSAITSTTDGDINFDDTTANACLTATSISTTLSTASNERVYAEEAQRYIDSLTDEELYKFEQMVSEHEQELMEKPLENIGKQKVKFQ